MKKKLLSLTLALTLCLGLMIPVSAAENTIYLRYKAGSNGTYSVEKTDDASSAALSLTGDVNITGVTSNSQEGQTDEKVKFLPYCVAFGPVALTLMRDSEMIAEARIDAVQTSGTGYLVTEERPVSFEGTTVTLSKPGEYRIEVQTTEYSLGVQAVIQINEPSVPSTPTVSEMPSASGFTDVPADSPFKAAIDWAVEKGVTNGKTATAFGPGDTCTVSHILTFLYRAANGTGHENERAAVTAWAESLGIDTGSLNAPCTRAMAVTYMWKAAGSPEADASRLTFTDFAAEDSFAPAIAWAVENKITSGTSETTFSPDSTCTRGQIATFLYRAFADQQ